MTRPPTVPDLTTPARVQRSRCAGSKLPEHTKCVTRGTRYGNMFAVRQLPAATFGRDRWTVVDLLGKTTGLRDVQPVIEGRDMAVLVAVRLYRLHTGPLGLYPLDVDQVRRDLTGWNLACWCPIGTPCHGDYLLTLANDPEPAPAV